MNDLMSYCGLVDAKIRASDKDLPVTLFGIPRKKEKETRVFENLLMQGFKPKSTCMTYKSNLPLSPIFSDLPPAL